MRSLAASCSLALAAVLVAGGCGMESTDEWTGGESSPDTDGEENSSTSQSLTASCGGGYVRTEGFGDPSRLHAKGWNSTPSYSWFAADFYAVINGAWQSLTGQQAGSLGPWQQAEYTSGAWAGGTFSVYGWIYDPCQSRFHTVNALFLDYQGWPQKTYWYSDGVWTNYQEMWVSSCGGAGQACCTGLNTTDRWCRTGNMCQSNSCVPCGVRGQACCVGQNTSASWCNFGTTCSGNRCY